MPYPLPASDLDAMIAGITLMPTASLKKIHAQRNASLWINHVFLHVICDRIGLEIARLLDTQLDSRFPLFCLPVTDAVRRLVGQVSDELPIEVAYYAEIDSAGRASLRLKSLAPDCVRLGELSPIQLDCFVEKMCGLLAEREGLALAPADAGPSDRSVSHQRLRA